MKNLNFFKIRTSVAIATVEAKMSCAYFTMYEAQRISNPELFAY